MNFTDIIAWGLLIVGAVVTFGAKPFLKLVSGESGANEENEENKSGENNVYVIKTIGMLAVVVGAVIIFLQGGSFGR